MPAREAAINRSLDGRNLEIQYRLVGELKAYKNNARTHTKLQIRQIAESIKQFGFVTPILIDRNDQIVAGHGRVQAAKLCGHPDVPTICLESLSESQVRAYMIADNRLAELAGWDRGILAIELQHLLTIEDELDITVTGFEIAEIDLILEDAQVEKDCEELVFIPSDDPPITQPGDIWNLGPHQIACLDACKVDSFGRLMGKLQANAVVTDFPYNVRIDGHATGNGKVHHREFAMASGEMSPPEFVAFLTTVIKSLSQYSHDEALQFLFMDWRHVKDLLTVGEAIYNKLLNICVWVKHAGGMGSFYRSQHEFVTVFRNGKEKHRNNIQLGKYGRNRTNVWNYPGANSLGKLSDEGKLSELHPTVKPVALVADALLDCSARGDLVLDPFLGSGTTLMAAERVGRICFGMEIDPAYVDLAIKRWQNWSGQSAVHSSSEKTFNELVLAQGVQNGEEA